MKKKRYQRKGIDMDKLGHVAIWGAGCSGKKCADFLKRTGTGQVFACADSNPSLHILP